MQETQSIFILLKSGLWKVIQNIKTFKVVLKESKKNTIILVVDQRVSLKAYK